MFTSIARWKGRYVESGVLALVDAPGAGRQDHRVSARAEAKILRLSERPRARLTHRTARPPARQVGVSSSTVLRIWQRAGPQTAPAPPLPDESGSCSWRPRPPACSGST